MSTFWERIVSNYNYLFDDLSHPFTKDWLLAKSQIPLFTILLTYNIFCTKIGPMLMKNRPPYKLETPIKIYNISQIIISLYLTYEGFDHFFSGKFNFNCQGVEEDYRVTQGVQSYYITKLIELLDTIFFVLRKSDRQITFLHLFHHSLMPFATWIGLKYFPGGQNIFLGIINSFVHIIMYTYYFVAALGPKYQKYLWWKKYVTVLQIVQFFIILLHSTNSLFYSCEYPQPLKVLTILFSSVLVYLFCNFYYHTYINKRNHNNQESSTHSKYQKSITNGNKDDGSNGNSISVEKTIINNGYFSNGELNGNKNGSTHANDKQFDTKESRKNV